MPPDRPAILVEEIRDAVASHRFRVTDHADEEAANDRLHLDDILHSAATGEIIESYPDDKPYPSCLVFGRSAKGDAIHSVWAYNRASRWAVLVTVYRPDPRRWKDWQTRIR
ncbi:MAG TPA: DUF4258 domain-containing protein [Phycisphaerae bacterium]|nr:DUF4258 domain-containing protein [Phycisphaerae bacterium]